MGAGASGGRGMTHHTDTLGRAPIMRHMQPHAEPELQPCDDWRRDMRIAKPPAPRPQCQLILPISQRMHTPTSPAGDINKARMALSLFCQRNSVRKADICNINLRTPRMSRVRGDCLLFMRVQSNCGPSMLSEITGIRRDTIGKAIQYAQVRASR